MKKVLILLLVAVMVGAMAADVEAKRKEKNRNRGRRGRGAVKTMLYARQEGDDPAGPGSGDKAGKVVLNTDDEGILIVNAKLKKGAANAVYDVTVVIDGVATADGQLTTNKKGKGSAHAEMDVSGAYPAESIEVQVVLTAVDPADAGAFATATEAVPLKPLDEPDPEPEP